MEEKTQKCWCAIIPFARRGSAAEALEEIRDKTGFDGLVKELELTEKELK